jgi:hypothetical protein
MYTVNPHIEDAGAGRRDVIKAQMVISERLPDLLVSWRD